MTHEYAFDVKLAAVIRVTAESEEQARTMLRDFDGIGGFQIRDLPTGLVVTEASVDDANPLLFEVDGEEAEEG